MPVTKSEHLALIGWYRRVLSQCATLTCGATGPAQRISQQTKVWCTKDRALPFIEHNSHTSVASFKTELRGWSGVEHIRLVLRSGSKEMWRCEDGDICEALSNSGRNDT